MRKNSNKLTIITFIILVIFPTAVTAIYYFQYASDQHTTESKFIIQANSQKTGGLDQGLFSGVAGLSNSIKDSIAVQEFILSRDFVTSLSKSIDIRKIYSDGSIDWWARLPEDASEEDLLLYWKDQTTISHDTSSGISTLSVTSFDQQSPVDISLELLRRSEVFVNSLSEKIRQDAVDLSAKELLVAKEELDQVRSKIYSLNQKEEVINPAQRATAEESIVSELNQKLATAEAELTRLKSFMQSSSMKVRATQAEINSLKMQITKQQERWKKEDPVTGKSVTTFVQDTSQFITELALAEKIYESAVSDLRQAKREAKQQQRYLQVIVKPQLPDEATKPERVTSTLTVFLACIMGWGIISLIIASTKDHLGWV